MNQILLIVWGGLTIAAIATLLLVRRRSNKPLKLNKPPKLELLEFISLSVAIQGVMSGCQLIYKAFTWKALQDLLGADVVVLVVGGVAVIWVSTKEVWKIIVGN